MNNILIKSISVAIVMLFSFGNVFAQAQKHTAEEIHLDDRDDYAKAINEKFNNGQWEEGKKDLDAGLEKYPKDSDLKMLAGKYYHHKKQYDKARYELKKSLEYNADNVAAKQVLVNVEMESGRYSSAICYVNELLEVNPYWRGLWRKKIELYELQGNIVEANRLRKRISQIYPEDSELQSDFLYNTEVEANIKRKEGKIEEAISLSESLVKEQPKNADYYLLLINDYLRAGDRVSALAYTERALGLFPGNVTFINKKVGILAEQKRYDELLSFLQEQRKLGNSAELQRQYSYYLIEAARNAKDKDPSTLYGKILEGNPGDEEAFNYVFNSLVAGQQYGEALYVLNNHRRVKGNSKNLAMRELMVYERMGNTNKAAALTKSLFAQYPNDDEITDAYVKVKINEARTKMTEERYLEAIDDWNEVRLYGDDETIRAAQNSICNAYILAGDYENALKITDEMMKREPNSPRLFVKKSDIYLKQKRYYSALTAYEQAMDRVGEEQKQPYLNGYAELNTVIIKDLNEQYRYEESREYVKQWLERDPNNVQALKYAVNLAHITNHPEDAQAYAEMGNEATPDDVFFKIKLAETKGKNHAEAYEVLHEALLDAPYHKDLISAFEEVAENYAHALMKGKESARAIVVLDTALRYAPDSRMLKHTKGIAFDKLHQFDSAYYYQSFYEPSLMEMEEFQQKLFYLSYKSYLNEIGLTHIRSRFGDNYTISTISMIEYIRHQGKNTFTGRTSYAGRETGRGVQIQGEWGREWNEKTRTTIDAAWANKFFPIFAANASIFRDFNILDGIEAELGIGYRRLDMDTLPNRNLWNVVIGATKEIEPWRLNARFNTFLLKDNIFDGRFLDGRRLLFNFSTSARYTAFASPRNYLQAMASIGTSPDVDMVNYALFNGFNAWNTMLGAGVGRMLTKTISLSVLGTWNNYVWDNYKVEEYVTNGQVVQIYKDSKYRNLYTIFLNLNVVF